MRLRRPIGWLMMTLLAATPVVGYGLACAFEALAVEASPPGMNMQAEMPCPYTGRPGERVSLPPLDSLPGPDDDQEGFDAPPMLTACCVVTAVSAPPSFPAQGKKDQGSADPPEPELAEPPAGATDHEIPRLTTGPPPVSVPNRVHAGTRTYLLVSPRLRL